LKILVTGAAGFIGSEFVLQLANSTNHEIVVIDAFTYAGKKQNLSSLRKLITILKGDICDQNFVTQVFKKYKFDLVVHFAAETHVDNSINSPNQFIKTNVLGTFNLVNATNKYPISKFVYVSTDEVYGSIKEGFASEDSSLNPSSPYSASKAGGEFLITSYGHTFKLNYNIVRCSNNYGPRQNAEKLIPMTIKRLSANKLVPIYGTGNNIREWLHVSDCASAISTIAFGASEVKIFNIGSGDYHTNLSVVHQIAQHMNCKNDYIEYVEDRKGHDFRYAINSSLLQKIYKWSPSINIRDGLKKTIDWYLSHPQYLTEKIK
jgi:dTDP-glucose 4,6-dehydratase